MTVLAVVWRYGPPALLVFSAAGLLVSSVRSEPGRPVVTRPDWLLLPLLIFWTGDAAVGENRPPFERAWKGAVAVLVWSAVAIVLWRQRRSRAALTRPAPTPAVPPTPVDPARPAPTPVDPARPAPTPVDPARPASTPADPARPASARVDPARPAPTPADLPGPDVP
jgi:hypothetical protein